MLVAGNNVRMEASFYKVKKLPMKNKYSSKTAKVHKIS